MNFDSISALLFFLLNIFETMSFFLFVFFSAMLFWDRRTEMRASTSENRGEVPGMTVHHLGDEAPPIRWWLEVQGSRWEVWQAQVAANSFWIIEHGTPSPTQRRVMDFGFPGTAWVVFSGTVVGYDCPSPRKRGHVWWHCQVWLPVTQDTKPCPWGGDSRCRESTKKCGGPRLLPLLFGSLSMECLQLTQDVSWIYSFLGLPE